MTKRRVRGAWRWRSNVPGSMFPGVERAHQPGPRAARAWLVMRQRRETLTDRGGRTLLRTDRPAGSKLQESRYAPQTSSKSNRHPVPAVQPSSSSVAVQSLAPAAWQMASASAKVLSRVHGQPAFDSPHTEQPGRGRDGQAGESLTSEQQRTCDRACGARSACIQHMHGACIEHSWSREWRWRMHCDCVPRAARPGP